MNEEEVIRDILSGNVNRYAEIVSEYQSIVANLCYKMGGARLDIPEMTQQVFVELYDALPRFRFKSKLSTFIYRITVNVVCKEFKHNKRVQLPPENAAGLAIASEDRNAEQEMLHAEQHKRLHQAIGMLHNEQRTALVLYTFNDFSYNDIAEVMQCSTAKVEALIFRARKNLRKLMEKTI